MAEQKKPVTALKKTDTKKKTDSKTTAVTKSALSPSKKRSEQQNGAPEKKRRAVAEPTKVKVKKESDPSSIPNQILPFVFLVCALLSLLLLVLETDGFIVKFLKSFFLGMFSAAAFVIPALFVLLGVFWQTDIVSKRVTLKFWCAGISLVLASMLMHVIFSGEKMFSVAELYGKGYTYESGGVIGGLLCSLLYSATGKVISVIIIIAALFVSTLLLFGLTPRSVEVSVRYKIKKYREEKRANAAITSITPLKKTSSDSTAAHDPIPANDIPNEAETSPHQHKFDPDIDMSKDRRGKKKAKEAVPAAEDQSAIDQRIFDEVMRRTRERYGEQSFDGAPDDTVTAVPVASVDADEDPPLEAKANIPEDIPVQIPEFTVRDYSEKTRTEKAPERPAEKKTSTVKAAASAPSDEIDLSKIFVDPDKIDLLRGDDGNADDDVPWKTDGELTVVKDGISEIPLEFDREIEVEAPEEPEIPVYEFPPLSLLAEPERATAADLEELKKNAASLVDILSSFHVRTRVSDVFRGPTITRYELTPESGTRVRSIANLSDDLALGLAVPNVRIEAPIPGKAAVGIEVPNKKRDNVYLRSLLERDEFTNAKSRLTCALGSDVAGDPVYCDIAKMPHMLVAGATGMGKSVCINSIVTSLLYKSTPQEIRLIMIDPKKVELTIYNGIPHLHVPVVSDVKKAAGTLAWAVTEMERRYELIESVNVRNIQSYNEITANDPEKEFMPQMVIIIDEFADLMMTVPDDVETSVCRIAQMGRAAGIHLIIGTQRPSVNVVTGLIKANIPSRIAFTMSSQVDSRTVIDAVGAEKLLGRGDMLYSPVGILKPQRVQGAFVSEAEVQRVIDYIKGTFPEPLYDTSAIEGIEEASAKCGQKKGKAGTSEEGFSSDGAPDDPMLRQAIELAVETGKISTSLIQRRLSLGYGRAAKLIDTMEARGYVSAPDGQRPRDVLITRQQFQELVLKDEV